MEAHALDVVRSILFLGAVGWSGVAAAQGCAETTSTGQISRHISTAEAAFASLDVVGYFEASDAIRKGLPCLGDTLSRGLAAEVHRYEGLRWVLERDPDRAAISFAAARAIQPAYSFPESLVPKGNPVRAYYDQIELIGAEFEEVRPPAHGTLLIDGAISAQRPMAWPTIAQFVDEDGFPTATVLLDRGEPLPTYEFGEGVVQEPGLVLPPPREPRNTRKPVLLGSTVGAALATGIFAGMSAGARARFWDPQRTGYGPEVDKARRQSNGYTVAAGVAGAVTVGSGVGLALVW